MGERQGAVDIGNAGFWDELCGTTLAQRVGVEDSSSESLARFDRAYFEMYPYLPGYLPPEFDGRRTLEIGLGYGTLGQLIASRGADYNGLDIAVGPVEMMRHRLRQLGHDDADARVIQHSVLELPHRDESFDCVVSIGCLHHTGDLPHAIGQVKRVLRPGGTAVVMLYNRHSLRQLSLGLRSRFGKTTDADVRGAYDANAEGDAAPHTDFVSRADVRKLFDGFSSVRTRAENFDDYALPGGLRIPGRALFGNVARLVGLDLYITARK